MVTDRNDIQLEPFIENAEALFAKLWRYCDSATVEEMAWTPTGIKNSPGWILRHCAGLLWVTYGRMSSEPVPSSVQDSGIAWSSMKGTLFEDSEAALPQSADDCLAYLDTAWSTLREYVEEASAEWESRMIVFERKERSIWTFLSHQFADLAYHTGQASTLRKLLAVECRHSRHS